MKGVIFSFLGQIKSFLTVKRSIKAKIFVSFSIVAIIISVAISFYWYNVTIKSITNATVEDMDKSIINSLSQLDNAIGDIMQMHSIIIYETNSMDYIMNSPESSPSSEWFERYHQVYNDIRIMCINLSRTVSGIAVYKNSGETCSYGTTSMQDYMIGVDEVVGADPTMGNDVFFILKKPYNANKSELEGYCYIGRQILDKSERQAVIITKINEDIFRSIFTNRIYPDGFTLLLDENNSVIYDSSPEEYIAEKAAYIDDMEKYGGVRSYNDFMAFSKKSQYMGMTILSAVPHQYINDLNNKIRFQLLIISAVVILIIAVVSMVISNRITLGLQSLSNNMNRVGEGSLTNLDLVDSKDEVGRLNYSLINMAEQIKNLMENIKENEGQKREMEIKVLRAQISPHFLYNSLNTINYLSMLQNAENIHILTSSLIELLQFAVNIDDTLITVSDEIKYVKNYITVQKYRFPQEILVDYQVDSQAENCKTAKMILQPIVENALIHGLASVKQNGMIRIKAYVAQGNIATKNEALFFTVTDNGKGMSEEKIAEIMRSENNKDKMRFNGIGVRNVDERIKMQFGNDYGVSVYSQEGVYTTLEIKLPIIGGNSNCK